MNCDRPIALEILLAELEGNRLEVGLVPQRIYTNVGGMIRVAMSRNATWYRRFCERHPSSRRRNSAAADTRIKRRNVVSLLERMIAGRSTTSKYAAEILRIAEREAMRIAA